MKWEDGRMFAQIRGNISRAAETAETAEAEPSPFTNKNNNKPKRNIYA